MLSCEIGKIESAEEWRSGDGKKPSKGYFDPESEWGDWSRVFERQHGHTLLERVPLCTLRDGEEPGGALETNLVDLRPVTRQLGLGMEMEIEGVD